LYAPDPGIVELNPQEVWGNLCHNIQKLNSLPQIRKDPIYALSITVSGCEAIPIDKDGNCLYNAIMSMDKRGKEENDWIIERIGINKLYEITGQPPSPFYALNRLIWFRRNRPEIYRKIKKFLCWEEFLLLKFGSKPITDYSVATNTLAFDINKREWSEEILNKLDVERNLFPDTYPSGIEVGTINKKSELETGLVKSAKLVTGGFDQTCAALGAGITKSGMASIGTGTMEVVHVCFNKPTMNEKMLAYGYPFCNHVFNDLYILISLNFCAGALLKWYRDNFSREFDDHAKRRGENAYDTFLKSAVDSQYPVLFLPYFEGSQTPLNDPNVSGSILGLRLRTKNEDIICGMLEGITFDLKLNLEKIEEAGVTLKTLRATGGGAKSDIWLKFKANITGRVIQKMDVDEAGCLSTAVLAGFGVKMFNSIEDTINAWVKVKKEFYPDRELFKKYEQKYFQFLDVYNSISKYRFLQ
jgi:xylulokinase